MPPHVGGEAGAGVERTQLSWGPKLAPHAGEPVPTGMGEGHLQLPGSHWDLLEPFAKGGWEQASAQRAQKPAGGPRGEDMPPCPGVGYGTTLGSPLKWPQWDPGPALLQGAPGLTWRAAEALGMNVAEAA